MQQVGRLNCFLGEQQIVKRMIDFDKFDDDFA